jgi:hypothetical protein
MFCSGCGQNLPDAANFCQKCGKPQKPELKATGADAIESKYELCAIVYCTLESGGFFSRKARFWAKAVGQTGVYNAGESDVFQAPNATTYSPDGRDKKTNACLNALITQLIAEGWEPISESGPDWFSHKFKRRIG